MDLSEFKPVHVFLKECREDTNVESIKPAHFASVMASAFQSGGTYLVRDFLDVDRTFAVISRYPLDLKEGVAVLQDVRDYLEQTTYDKVKQVGLIDLQSHTGFWVLI